MLLTCLIVWERLVAGKDAPEGGGQGEGPSGKGEGKEMSGLAPNYVKPLHKRKYQWRPVKLYLVAASFTDV